MWETKAEQIPGSEDNWRVAVYKDGELRNYHAEGLSKSEAEMIAKNLQRKFDEN